MFSGPFVIMFLTSLFSFRTRNVGSLSVHRAVYIFIPFQYHLLRCDLDGQSHRVSRTFLQLMTYQLTPRTGRRTTNEKVVLLDIHLAPLLKRSLFKHSSSTTYEKVVLLKRRFSLVDFTYQLPSYSPYI